MFGKKIYLFSLMGFKVSIDLSWLILAALIIWTLAKGYFPHAYEGLPEATYWWMGVAGMFGLVFSIVFHEFSHSLVARRFGMPMKGITLFIFGGVAEMDDEPTSPKGEFLMAIAGPVSSVVLGLVLLGIVQVGKQAGFPIAVEGVLSHLMWLNFILAGFNMLPAYPLDGGRVLRSILWGAKHNLKWATRISSRMGAGFGILLIVLGVFNILAGAFIGGLWWFLIGLFVKNAAEMSYRQVIFRNILSGHRVQEIMADEPVTVPADLTLDRLVEDYFYRFHHRMYPVLEDGHVAGYVTTRHLREYGRDAWSSHKVKEIVEGLSDENTLSPDTDAFEALKRMNRSGQSRMLVVEDGRVAGLVTLKDLMGYLFIKMDIEE